jgi:hypothetical protein
MDIFTASTLTADEEICCPHCGSWTHINDIIQDEITGETSCPLCKNPSNY